VYKLVRKEALPVDIQLLLFDSMIEPILIDGSEVLGYENLKFIEQIHLKYCKRVLQVRNTTLNFMVLGELGRFPIEVKVKLRMISFWSRLIQSDSKLSSILYKLMLSLYEQNQHTFKWIKCVESIFNEVGLGYIFQNQVGYFDISMVKQILRDQFIQKWHSDINNSSRGQFYSGFKNDFCLENYLLRLSEYNRKWITKFRTSNLRLPIETGRWYNNPMEDRKCNFCGNGIGDEFHILFICENEIVVILRNKYIPNYYRIHPSYFKLVGLLSICNAQLYKKKSIYFYKKNYA
jgi:hypothetical protein